MKFKSVYLLAPLACMVAEVEAKSNKKAPNIVIIIADDLGWGDVSAYGAKEIQTPGIDRIANEGIRFTNGHATSATSSPSRFGLLTGRYPWRNKVHVLRGDAAAAIKPEMETLPKMLQEAGYKTAAVGKWHLGMGNGNADWNKLVSPGAKEVGFDYSYLMAATNDRVPTVYVRDGLVVNLDPNDPIKVSYKQNFPGEPTGKGNPELLKMHPSHGHNQSITNGIPRIGYMTGGKSAHWVDEDMADLFLEEASNFVKENKDQPFFLYYALHQPHVPRVPHSRFAGKSSLGPRGDVILEADWCVDEFLKVLDKEGIADNTIVIFTSDNGHVLDDGYKDQAKELNGSHTPSGLWSGAKYSILKGGTCVPFLVRWPEKVKPAVSSALVSQIDFYNSFATIVGGEAHACDSEDVSNALIGKSKKGRDILVVNAGTKLSLISEEWAYIPVGEVQKSKKTKKTTPVQLYNLLNDMGQKTNVSVKYPDQIAAMKQQLEVIKGNNK